LPGTQLDLITAASPDDPLLDIALTHALLREVAGGRRPPALRVFRPGPTLAFGRLDVLLPGFADASAAARRHGYTPVVRSAGGHAAVYDERCLVVEHVTREDDVTAGLQARFEAQSALLRAALARLGADARIGALAGEYCAGAHSINLGGRIKVVGIAQRAIRHGALTTAVVVVGGGVNLRAVIAEVYGALDLDVDPATAGALDDELPGVTVERVATVIADAYATDARLEPAGIDAELLAAARALTPRHVSR
jgi:octanoyl-[GcvH]:protein N-octanoyltransferase